MLNLKGCAFPTQVVLVGVRRYAAHSLTQKYHKEMKQERAQAGRPIDDQQMGDPFPAGG